MSDTSKEIRAWIQIIAIVFTVGWTSYEFFFKDFIKPKLEPTALELNVKLEQVGEKDGFIMVKGTIDTMNPSSRRIYVPALWYIVKGSRITMTKERMGNDQTLPENLPTHAAIRLYAPVSSSEVVVEEKILSSRYPFWDPNDKTRDEVSFAVPKGEFDFLDIKVMYLFAKDNRDLPDPAWFRTGDGKLQAYLKFEKEKTTEEWNQWHYDNGAGENWSTASLSLWDKSKTQ
jgi:hypothetical protein